MENKNIFAENLQKYMAEKGVSRRELGEALGISYYTVTSWVNGSKYPRMDKVEMMADYFGIKKSDLIEEKVTDEQKVGNEALAGIIVRLRMDAGFRQIVETLNTLDAEKLKGVQQMLDAFAK